MTSHLAEKTVVDIALPAPRRATPPPPADRHLRAMPAWGPAAVAPGSVGPGAAHTLTSPAPRQRSFAPPPSGRPTRAFVPGGPAPTVIRDLDALFAADRARRSSTPAPARSASISGAQPIAPERLAQALLEKVQADFAPPPVARLAPAPGPARAPVAAQFVVGPVSQRDLPTVELALPDDDDDLVQLLPWYTRVWRALFGR